MNAYMLTNQKIIITTVEEHEGDVEVEEDWFIII